MNEPVLRTEKLRIGYENGRLPPHVVAEQIDVSLHAGELVCLLGPNGAGKSTLMRTLATMQPPLAGKVWLGAQEVRRLSPRALARQLSIVLTERVNVGNLSAYALVALGRHPYTGWSGKLAAHDETVVRWAITAVDAVKLAHRQVAELSDGERQKIMIARALAQEPQVMLLDEPTAFLDLPRRVEVMRILRRLAHEENRAILLSTHDLDLALRSADRIWLMPLHGALQVGAPEDLVLSGAFQQAFYSEGVEFDPYSGSFKMQQREVGVIDVVGDGLPAIWTARALEREGFNVHQGLNGSPLKVEVVAAEAAEDAQPRWRLVGPAGQAQLRTVQALIAALRQQTFSDS